MSAPINDPSEVEKTKKSEIEARYSFKQKKYMRHLKSVDIKSMRREVAEWIGGLAGKQISPEKVVEELKSGVVLLNCAKILLMKKYQSLESNLESQQILQELTPDDVDLSSCKGVVEDPQLVARCRNNISKFLKWSKDIGVKEITLFESEDLVLEKNEYQVFNCILRVSAIMARFGVEAPESVKEEMKLGRSRTNSRKQTNIDSIQEYSAKEVVLDKVASHSLSDNDVDLIDQTNNFAENLGRDVDKGESADEVYYELQTSNIKSLTQSDQNISQSVDQVEDKGANINETSLFDCDERLNNSHTQYECSLNENTPDHNDVDLKLTVPNEELSNETDQATTTSNKDELNTHEMKSTTVLTLESQCFSSLNKDCIQDKTERINTGEDVESTHENVPNRTQCDPKNGFTLPGLQDNISSVFQDDIAAPSSIDYYDASSVATKNNDWDPPRIETDQGDIYTIPGHKFRSDSQRINDTNRPDMTSHVTDESKIISEPLHGNAEDKSGYDVVIDFDQNSDDVQGLSTSQDSDNVQKRDSFQDPDDLKFNPKSQKSSENFQKDVSEKVPTSLQSNERSASLFMHATTRQKMLVISTSVLALIVLIAVIILVSVLA